MDDVAERGCLRQGRGTVCGLSVAVAAWLQRVCSVAVAWLQRGYSVAAAWLQRGCGVAAAWLWRGCGVAPMTSLIHDRHPPHPRILRALGRSQPRRSSIGPSSQVRTASQPRRATVPAGEQYK